MANPETAKKITEPIFIPGIVYIPDKIEVAEQPDLLLKVESDFADFLRCVTEILELMHLLKLKHLRSMVPLPLNVLREMHLLQGKGPLFRKFDKQTGGCVPGISASADNIFRRGMSSVAVTMRMKPALRKTEAKKKPLEADLIEIIGKKTKPLWHAVALEPHIDPLLKQLSAQVSLLTSFRQIFIYFRSTTPSSENVPKYLNWEEGEEEPPCPPDRILAKKDLPLSRTQSEEIIASIKYLSYTKVQPSDRRCQKQMDMLAASSAGFKSVDAYKSYLDTLKPHWFKDLVRDAAKVGLISTVNVIEAFEKLGQYYDMTSTSLSLPKPKLCFLVMSMPLWDIARMPVQMAISFILYNILKVPKTHNYLEEWLGARKLPYLVLPPVYAELIELQGQTTQPEEVTADAAKK